MKIKYGMGNNRDGFSLVESMLSLLLMAMAFAIMTFTCDQIKNNRFNKAESSYYKFLDVLESDKYQFKVIEITKDNDVELMSKTDHKKYVLNQYRNMIRLRSENGGHMPLILEVKKVRWNYKRHILQINVNTGGYHFKSKSKL